MAKISRRVITSLTERGFTSYEVSVYKAVAGIPCGQTRSYKWVARRLGRPNSFRAVGNALQKNPYTLLIPCHRVIKSNGSIGGFARGSRAKIRLLRSEGIDIIGSKIRR